MEPITINFGNPAHVALLSFIVLFISLCVYCMFCDEGDAFPGAVGFAVLGVVITLFSSFFLARSLLVLVISSL